MPWKQLKAPAFSQPTRQDLIILAASLMIGLVAITFFILRS